MKRSTSTAGKATRGHVRHCGRRKRVAIAPCRCGGPVVGRAGAGDERLERSLGPRARFQSRGTRSMSLALCRDERSPRRDSVPAACKADGGGGEQGRNRITACCRRCCFCGCSSSRGDGCRTRVGWGVAVGCFMGRGRAIFDEDAKPNLARPRRETTRPPLPPG